MAAMMVTRCLTQQNAACVYITITIKVAKRNMWRTLKRFNDEFGLGAVFNNTELSMTFANGAFIMLGGAETQADIDKYRGSPWDLIVLDESKSFPGDLITELVEDVLQACLGDRLGTLVMGGTPGSILAGSFYEATREEAFMVVHDGLKRYGVSRPWTQAKLERWKGAAFKWSHHAWTTRDNIKMPHLWKVQLADKERNGWTDEHPSWQREYLGRWLPSADGMVFRFNPSRDLWKPDEDRSGLNVHGLPDEHDWRYVLGIDLGYDDDTAFVVFAWADTSPILYQVDEYAAPYMLPHEIAAKYKELEEKFGEFAAAIGDRGGLGKTILATLDYQYGISIEAAEKTEKRDHVELFNADLVSGRLKVMHDSKLAMQMAICQWDETGKRFEKDLPDHCVDAAIYVWRYCYHHFSQARMRDPDKGTPAWHAKKSMEEFERFREREERRAYMDDSERMEDDMGLDTDESDSWGGLDGLH